MFICHIFTSITYVSLAHISGSLRPCLHYSIQSRHTGIKADNFHMSNKKATTAAVWSFFIPPVGLILGLIAYRKADSREAQLISLGAIWNSVISSIIWVLIIFFIVWFFNSGAYQNIITLLNSR